MSDRATSAFAKTQDQREDTKAIATVFDQQHDRYTKLLPTTIKLEDFRNAFLTAVQRQPRLLEADRPSLWIALQQAASDGLKPDNREGALVIFADDEEDESGNRVPSRAARKRQIVWMPMVYGLLKTVRNAKEVERVTVECVYKGEHISIVLGDDPKFEHTRSTEPDFDDGYDRLIGAYAIIKFSDGEYEREWMSRAKIERVRAVGRAKKGSSPWNMWPDEQARKTVLRRLMKRLDRASQPALEKMAESLDRDETIGQEIEGEAREIVEAVAAAPQQPLRRRETRERPGTADTSPLPEEAGTASPHEPEPPLSDDGGFQAWLVDADGVQVRDQPYLDPVSFAKDIAQLVRGDPERAVDIETNNAAAIEEAAEASAEAAAIFAKINALPTRIDEPQPEAVVVKGESLKDQMLAHIRSLHVTELNALNGIAQWRSQSRQLGPDDAREVEEARTTRLSFLRAQG